ncbi:hypothetical protein [Motilimonas eburnea]|nr:hypothetical protein [Motilimonas eburnea]
MAEKIISVFDKSLKRITLPSMTMAEFTQLLAEIKRQREQVKSC